VQDPIGDEAVDEVRDEAARVRLPRIALRRGGDAERGIHNLVLEDEHGEAEAEAATRIDAGHAPAHGAVDRGRSDADGVVDRQSRRVPLRDRSRSDRPSYPAGDDVGGVLVLWSDLPCPMPGRFRLKAVEKPIDAIEDEGRDRSGRHALGDVENETVAVFPRAPCVVPTSSTMMTSGDFAGLAAAASMISP
jgi:hypothetical protein